MGTGCRTNCCSANRYALRRRKNDSRFGEIGKYADSGRYSFRSEYALKGTNRDGTYRLGIPADGHYTIQVQMSAFATSSQEVVLDATHPSVQTNFELVLLSRAGAPHNEQQRANAGGAGGGSQNLTVFQNATGQDAAGGSMNDVVPAGMPVPGIAPDSATESVAVSGNTSCSAITAQIPRATGITGASS